MATLTQVVIEALDGQSAELDLTHAVIETLSPLSAPAWLTHAVIEILGTMPLYTEGRPTGGESLCDKWRVHTWLEWNV